MTLEQIEEFWNKDIYFSQFTRIEYRAVYDYQVLAVAVVFLDRKEWRAYIGGVLGYDHSKEWIGVRRSGTKIPKEMADLLFPDMPQELIYCEE